MAEFDEKGYGFPIRALVLGPKAFKALLNPRVARDNDALVTKIINLKLKEFIEATHGSLIVKNGEVLVETRTDPTGIIRSCEADIRSGYGRAEVKVRRTSHLTTATGLANSDDKLKATVFVGGDIDVTMKLNAMLNAKLGKSFFGKCFTKYKSEFPTQIYSRARVWMGARIFATDVRIEKRAYDPKNPIPNLPSPVEIGNILDSLKSSQKYNHGQQHHNHQTYNPHQRSYQHSKPKSHSHQHQHPNSYQDAPALKTEQHLVFKIKLKLDARIKRWDVDHIGITNCQIKVLGLKVVSFCGAIRQMIRDYVSESNWKLNEIEMPRMLRQFERMLRYRFGDEIAIPLLLAEEKSEIVETLMQKADNVAKLKGDLVKDLSGVAKGISDGIAAIG